jgi:hypothetical protein
MSKEKIVKGVDAIIERLKARDAAAQAELAHIVEVANERLRGSEERKALAHAHSYQKPFKHHFHCEICGVTFGAWRSDARTCGSDKCRKRFYRQSKKHSLSSHQDHSKRFW